MSKVKKIWMIVAVVITIMIGFSVTIMQMSGNNTVTKKPVKKPMKRMIMKCGAGKCGAAMMEEVEVDSSKN